MKVGRQPPNPRKATFLLHKRKPTNLVVLGLSQSASQRTRASTLKDKGDAQSMPTDTYVPTMALPPGAPPLPPLCKVNTFMDKLYDTTQGQASALGKWVLRQGFGVSTWVRICHDATVPLS